MMRSLVVVLILTLATIAQGDIFRWTTEDGVISFTDSEKKIPARYKEASEKVILGPFKDFGRLTIPAVNNEDVTPAPLRVTIYSPNRVDECTESVTVTSERRQFGAYSRVIYLVHDECGNLRSETFYQPEVRINR